MSDASTTEKEIALREFAEEDEAAAGAAFARLCAWSRPALIRHVCASGGQVHAEDVVQETFVRVWSFRRRFRTQGVKAWHAFLNRVARNCLRDLQQRNGACVPVEVPEAAIEEQACPASLDEEQAAVLASWLCQQANILWLDLDERLPPETHDRQLLAAQLFYLDGEPSHRIARLLGPGPQGEPPFSRALLDEWMEHPGVICYLFFHALYFDNDRLAAFLLGVQEEAPAEQLDALAHAAENPEPGTPSPPGWTWEETRMLLWRYRHALEAHRILDRDDCPFSREELAELLDRSRERFPFIHEMKRLLSRCGGAADGMVAVRKPGLWQRLAFEYAMRDDLPHRDIHERVAPAAAEVQYSLTLAALNAWLSNRRLFCRLRAYCAGRDAGGAADYE